MNSNDEKELLLKLTKEAAKFEEKLKETVTDPLKRAEERRDFYTKQRELLEDINVNRQELEKKEQTKYTLKNRTFDAFGEQTYSGPLISTPFENEEATMRKLREEVKDKRHPVYIDSVGKIYDINYIPIKVEKSILDDERGKLVEIQGHPFDHDLMDDKYSYVHDPELYQNPPDPESFITFEDYESALKDWSGSVERGLGCVQLPKTLGRNTFRPYVVGVSDVHKQVGVSGKIVPLGGDEVETWESYLIPQEPRPEFYKTYEEYEVSMIRWAIVVCKSPFLPPHPVQLNKLLGIQIMMKPEGYEFQDVEYRRSVAQKKVIETFKKLDGVLPTNIALDEWDRLPQESQTIIFERFIELLDKKKMSRETFGAFHRFMTPKIHGTFPKPGSKNKDSKSTNFMRRLSLSQFQTNTGQKKTDISTVKEWIISQRADRSLSSVFSKNSLAYYHAVSEDLFHQFPLRREDLSPHEIKGSRDCEEVEQGEKISFDIPDFEIGQIDFLKLKSVDYVRFLQIVLTRIDYGSRYSHLNSWYYPKIPKSVHVDKFKELCSYFESIEHPSQVKGSLILDIFQNDSFFDVFVNWLNIPYPKKLQMLFRDVKEDISHYKTLLFAVTTLSDTLKQILSLFNQSANVMIHAKVAFFILQFLKTRFSEPVVEQLITDKDLGNLCVLTTMASFFDEVPMNVFTVSQETLDSVNRVLCDNETKMKPSYEAFLNDLFVLYYLDSLGVSLLEGDNGYPQIYPLILKKMEVLIVSIENWLENNSEFLSKHIWRVCSYKISEVSACGVFILSFLMTLAYRPKIYKKITGFCDLVSNLRKMALVKYSHVQDAVGRIFPQLRKPKWRGLLVDVYQHTEPIHEDLFSASTATAIDAQPPLIASITLDFMCNILKLKKNPLVETKVVVNGLIQGNAFGKVLSDIMLSVEQKKLHQGLTMGATFLATFVKYLLCHNMIEIKDDKSVAGTGKGTFLGGVFGKKSDTTQQSTSSSGAKLEVYVGDLVSLLDLIVIGFEKTINKKTFRFRTALIDCLRHLLKIPNAFNKLKGKEKMLFQKILTICKDTDDMEFNRNAWRLFYQTFKFQVGTVDLLKTAMDTSSTTVIGKNTKQKTLLEVFWDLIYPDIEDKNAWNILATHSIHYFSKILSLPHKNEKYIDPYASDDSDDDKEKHHKKTHIGGNVPADEAVKGYAKAIEGMIAFVTLKDSKVLETAYKQLSTSYAGWPFQALALMFWYIAKCPTSKKLVEHLRKGREKDCLEKIACMFNGPDD